MDTGNILLMELRNVRRNDMCYVRYNEMQSTLRTGKQTLSGLRDIICLSSVDTLGHIRPFSALGQEKVTSSETQAPVGLVSYFH